jgi:alpha-N-arabinofuranosidase
LSSTLPANAWKQFTLPLSALNAADKTNLARLTIQFIGGSGTFYLDDIQLNPVSAPPLVHLGVDASQTIRSADARWFGLNTATWDGELGNSQTLPLLKEEGCTALRWPGGSTSDTYHWASDPSGNARFMNLVTNLGAQSNSFITVNYGSGTSNEAAAWVMSVNITNHCGVRYWEIGNENYGTWETDNNNLPHDPATYARRAAGYYQLMKAADPAIRVGVVVITGEDTDSNGSTNFAVNPRTGVAHNGWTPVMLATLKNEGTTPDFVIYHFYPQFTAQDGSWQPNSTDSDPLLLQAASNWRNDAADLRRQISDYLGAAGTNVEIVCTENNSDAGSMGRQSTSIVNALYLADSVSQLMKTEFNSYVWWDLHNGSDTSGDFDATLYGWRGNGDYGVLNGSNIPYPVFYAQKLLQSFVRPGDTVLNASSDYLALSAYAARKADGALALLVINKTPADVFDAEISLTNFVPWPAATMRSYGIAQDEATRTNGVAAAQDIYTNTMAAAPVFTNSFPPYSMTLLTFAPAAASLAHPLSIQPGGQFAFQLQGQAGVPYVIQSSTNLSVWTSISTNVSPGGAPWLTNPVSSGGPVEFWRAVWQP